MGQELSCVAARTPSRALESSANAPQQPPDASGAGFDRLIEGVLDHLDGATPPRYHGNPSRILPGHCWENFG